MYILGLTGGMAAGKSTVSKLFRRAGVPVFDADACVRDLQKPHGKAIPEIERAFPEAVKEGVLQREKLRAIIAQKEGALAQLEAIIHPLVRQERKAFLQKCRHYGVHLCVLDIPLLMETGADKECDLVLVVQAPLSVRLARIRKRFRRDGKMSEAEARRLIARQMSDQERRRRADIVLQTGLSRGHLARQVHALVHRLETERAQ
ncbi:dephospho-CoA kinase [Saccharibacter sp. 17.LH.SD]|uniref:dephospho-CoA kinase n=1 Tax=Saccharibacter sp. 17.LH.SD TaxID=2689393 RepID=UPI00136E724A|nr:dephospho-CoA kinase [Saccharibacter sp. 17.LH.SD]MXV44545.1 dephospho-CoA kinase [Saccharibacter sp. 17.LH.SD]